MNKISIQYNVYIYLNIIYLKLKRYLYVVYLIVKKKGLIERNMLKVKEREGVFDCLVFEKIREYLIYIKKEMQFFRLIVEKEESVDDSNLGGGERDQKMNQAMFDSFYFYFEVRYKIIN